MTQSFFKGFPADLPWHDEIFVSESASEFQGRAPDLKYVESAARLIAKTAIGRTLVVEKSTVPVKAAESISSILSSTYRSDVSFQVRCSSVVAVSLVFILGLLQKSSFSSACRFLGSFKSGISVGRNRH
jgi:hypothetical protein